MNELVSMTVNLDAFRHNFTSLQEYVGMQVPIIAVVKADGYGYGLIPMAHEAAHMGAWAIGVASGQEAMELRASGMTNKIVMLYPCLTEQVHDLVVSGIEMTVTSIGLLNTIINTAHTLQKDVNIHLQLETGMHHYGMETAEIAEAIALILAASHIKAVGLSTHFSSAANDIVLSKSQGKRFIELVQNILDLGLTPNIIHCANSAAVDTMPEYFSNELYGKTQHDILVGVRCGSLLYGSYPTNNPKLQTKPVLESLATTVMEVKSVVAGETIGYFNTFQADRAYSVAILPIGWGVGFFPLDGKGYVLVAGTKAKVLGPIGANVCAIDVTDLDVEPGSEVVIIGKQRQTVLSLDEVAKQHGTFISRLVSQFVRIKKQYVS